MALGLLAAAHVCPAEEPAADTTRRLDQFQTRVVTVFNPNATKLFKAQAGPIPGMLEQGLTNYTGQSNLKDAWLSLVRTQDTIGIKVFTAPGRDIGTRVEVVEPVVDGLIKAGLPPRQIIVWDLYRTDLIAAGYGPLEAKYRIRLAGSAKAGYDDDVFYENSLLGKLIFGDHEFGKTGEGIGRKSFVSRLVTREMTRIILISPLLNHNRAGVCGNLYSLAMGSVDNFYRFEASPDRLAMAVPEICALPELGDRVILNIVDGLIAQYQGQRTGLLHYSAMLNEIRISRDPVSLDVLSVQELTRQREKAGIKTGVRNETLYKNATLLQIGESNPRDIYVERLEQK